MKKLSRKKLVTLGAGCVVVATAAAAASRQIDNSVQYVHPDYAVALNTPALASGWADDVFVGTIESGGVSRAATDGQPMTVYVVNVDRSLKGAVRGRIKVAQEGGVDRFTRERVVVGDAPSLRKGRTYVLATRVSPSGWNTAPSNFIPVAVGETMSAAVRPWVDGVANPANQASLYPSLIQSASTTQRTLLYANTRVK